MQRNQIILKGIKKFDLFAQPLQLQVDKKEYHQTLFGSILTVLLIALFSNLLYQKLVTLSDRSNPSSLTSEIYHSQPEQYSLTPFNFTMTFAFQNSTFNTYIDESIYVVNAYIVKKQVQNQNGQRIETYEKQELPLVKCNQELIKQKELQEYFSHLDLPTNYCIDWNSISSIQIEGTFDAPKFEYIIIQFNTCNEKTKKNISCKKQKDIEQQLMQNYFSFQISSQTTNLKNPNSPYDPKGQDLYTTISNNIYKEISIYLQPLTTITDIGLIQTDLIYEKTLRYGKHTEMLDLNQSDLIMNVVIRLDSTELVDYRTYPKLQEILAELGGLWQVLFSLFYIISKPINKVSLLLNLINSLYEFQDKQQNEENQQKDSSFIKNEKLGSPLQRQLEQQVQICQDQIITNKTLSIKDNICKKQGKKDKSYKTILQTYVQYIQKMIFKKNTNSKFGYLNAFQALRCIISKDDENILQFRRAHKEISYQLNIINILKRLQDVEKLKYIIFNENQRILFEKFNNFQKQREIQGEITLHNDQQIKQQGITQDAILQILQDQQNEINQKLIASLDVTVSDLLQKCKQENNNNKLENN
ncbi:unnamed protein product [Paramecium sonneborni]|uniref:Transmembrane protein n=1 Tax=Paramecium sonneborni TaxID=65129 RepID=A0A8S1MQ08_9CILI|nr:unnamed protein product [Paramecium sonneborni]